jgi:hypothetical protein
MAEEPSSPGALQNASLPRRLEDAPELLRTVLEAALSADNRGGVAAVSSPEFPSLRYYAGSSTLRNAVEDIPVLPGYYQAGRNREEAAALVIAPDGRGFIAGGRKGIREPDEFSLPPLPEGFVYTGVCLFSRMILGTWEEQDAWNVGAAGFVIFDPDSNYE